MQISIKKEEQRNIENYSSEQCKKRPKGRRLYTFLITGLLICSFMVGGILVFYGCGYSYYPPINTDANDILLRDNIFIHVLIILLVGILFWQIDKRIFQKLTCKKQETVCRSVLAVTAILLFASGTFLVHAIPYYPVGDQLNTTAGAYYAMEGNYIMLMPGGYIGLYQQQKGFMFLYEILFSIFGGYCYGVAQQFHVLFLVLTLVSGYGFVKNMSSRAIYRIIFCILMLLCAPFIIFLPYIYGDVPSICFCMILLWALSAYGKNLQKRYLVIACVAASLSLMCRMNTWIVLIAVAIGMLLTAIERWNYKPLVAGMCIILAAAGTIKAVDVMYEYRSGYESGIGIPSILWIAMGLQETDGEAGVYNRYQQTVFEENGFDREIAAQIGKDYIAGRLEEFRNNPQMAMHFFEEKILSQWMEPLFESLAATGTFEKGKAVTGWVKELYYGSLHNVVWKSANYYQSLVYVGIILCILGRDKKLRMGTMNSMAWIPIIALIGGFLFSLIWENQSRYCLPYYIFVLLDVPEGIMQIGNGMDGFIKKLGRKNSLDCQEENQLRKVS